MLRTRTFVLRQCIQCRGFLGLGIWPWSGERFTLSHGLCRSCFKELEAAAARTEPGPGGCAEDTVLP